MASQMDLQRRFPYQEGYPRALASLYRQTRLPDPSYAYSKEPDAEGKVLRDADIFHALDFRWRSIAGDQHQVQPGDDRKASEGRAVIEGYLIKQIKQFREALYNLARADLTGARYAQIQTARRRLKIGDGIEREWCVPVRLVDMPKENFQYVPVIEGELGSQRLSQRLQGFSPANNEWRDIEHPELLIEHVWQDSQETLGRGRGMIEPLYHWWHAKGHLFQGMAEAADRFGQGQVAISIDGLTAGNKGAPNTQIITDWINVIKVMRANNCFVHDSKDGVSLLEGSSTGWQILTEFYRMLQQGIDRLILGAQLPTGGGDSTVGSLARASVEQDSMAVKFATARASLEDTLTDDLLDYLCRVNYRNYRELGIHVGQVGRLKIIQDREQDTEKNGRVLAQALGAGIPVLRSEAYELLELTPPAEGDEVIKPQPAPSFGPSPFQFAAAPSMVAVAERPAAFERFEQERYPEGHPKGGKFKPKEGAEGGSTEKDGEGESRGVKWGERGPREESAIGYATVQSNRLSEVDEAKSFAEKHGASVTVSGDVSPDRATLIYADAGLGFATLSALGFETDTLPEVIALGGAAFKSMAKSETAAALYKPSARGYGSGRVFVNADHRMYSSDPGVLDEGHNMTEGTHGVMIHELFHAMHHRDGPEYIDQLLAQRGAGDGEWAGFPDGAEDDLAGDSTVKAYARSSPYEFVAEIGASIAQGLRVSDKAREWYARLGGPSPKAKRGARPDAA